MQSANGKTTLISVQYNYVKESTLIIEYIQ